MPKQHGMGWFEGVITRILQNPDLTAQQAQTVKDNMDALGSKGRKALYLRNSEIATRLGAYCPHTPDPAIASSVFCIDQIHIVDADKLKVAPCLDASDKLISRLYANYLMLIEGDISKVSLRQQRAAFRGSSRKPSFRLLQTVPDQVQHCCIMTSNDAVVVCPLVLGPDKEMLMLYKSKADPQIYNMLFCPDGWSADYATDFLEEAAHDEAVFVHKKKCSVCGLRTNRKCSGCRRRICCQLCHTIDYISHSKSNCVKSSG